MGVCQALSPEERVVKDYNVPHPLFRTKSNNSFSPNCRNSPSTSSPSPSATRSTPSTTSTSSTSKFWKTSKS